MDLLMQDDSTNSSLSAGINEIVVPVQRPNGTEREGEGAVVGTADADRTATAASTTPMAKQPEKDQTTTPTIKNSSVPRVEDTLTGLLDAGAPTTTGSPETTTNNDLVDGTTQKQFVPSAQKDSTTIASSTAVLLSTTPATVVGEHNNNDTLESQRAISMDAVMNNSASREDASNTKNDNSVIEDSRHDGVDTMPLPNKEETVPQQKEKDPSRSFMSDNDDDVRMTQVDMVEDGRTSIAATPIPTDNSSTTSLKPSNNSSSSSSAAHFSTIYGRPVPVTDSGGSFPDAGSVLGPFFCLGQLGKGTFSSIHKCIDMQYFHNNNNNNNANEQGDTGRPMSTSPQTKRRRRRLAAAKVELGSFQQSGVLEAEAIILDFLHRTVPPGTVPVYMGHYRSTKFAAIFMEYLIGEDMHQLRERVMAQQQPTTTSSGNIPATRRITVQDAVYFCADVMLPLLQSMHQVGVVHRDVKPSNCVRQGLDGKEFCMVDFGLSKSIIVPENSDSADKDHPWDEDKEWLRPLNYNKGNSKRGCYRLERKKADFRGTSMYASLRVHEERDYCPRDDMWSLLYVFCDLVSGGLPWMSHAANRNRDECHRLKVWVHTGGGGGNSSRSNDDDDDEGTAGKSSNDNTAELLKGDLYHVAKYRYDRQVEDKVDASKLTSVPEPLDLSNNEFLVDKLRMAFQHLSELQFWDQPDYAFLQDCIRSFNNVISNDPVIPSIEWSVLSDTTKSNRTSVNPMEDDDLDEEIFVEAEKEAKALLSRKDDFWFRLPMMVRYQLAQLDCNMASSNDGTVPPYRAIRDWMVVVVPLLYEEWDARKYEDGGHRTATDGFKRIRYLELLRKCDKYAAEFRAFFERRDSYYYERTLGNDDDDDATPPNGAMDAADSVASSVPTEPIAKRRKMLLLTQPVGRLGKKSNDLVHVSRALVGLRVAIKKEMAKKTAPPVRISFG